MQPGEAEIAQEIATDVDPDAVHRARLGLRAHIAKDNAGTLAKLYDDLADLGAYSPDAVSAGRRALRKVALDLLAAADPVVGEELAGTQFAQATNMTDRLAALSTLTTIPGDAREKALANFGERYRDEPLVLDKWFTLQATIEEPETLARIETLLNHPAFALSNPNRVRSLVGSFAMANQTQFNRADGAGYRFIAATILRVDRLNPQLAARLMTAFSSWRMMESGRRSHAEQALQNDFRHDRIIARRKRHRAPHTAIKRAIATP